MSFDDELARTLEALTDRLRDDVARQVRSVAGELTAAVQAEREALAPPPPAPLPPAPARLAEAVRALSEARSLTEILDTLVSEVGRDGSRVALVRVRGDRFEVWRLLGFEAPVEREMPLDIPRGDAGVILRAADTAAPAQVGDAPVFAQLLSGEPCIALPMAIAGQVVAVLYADTVQGTGFSAPATLDADRLEVLVLHAARCLEALTAIKAAHSLVAPSASPAPVADAIGDEYVSARRYARILVSEIKLYHEDQVVAGRRERDLANRLGGEIARVRALYDERVPASVRQHTDYVLEEVIRTLADGDASLLEAKAEA